MNDDTRLTRLEEDLMHLQRHVSEQDKVMLGLADEVSRLRLELAAQRARTSGHADADIPSSDERPPHY